MKSAIVIIVIFFASISNLLGKSNTIFEIDRIQKKDNNLLLFYKIFNLNEDKRLNIYVIDKSNKDTLLSTFTYYKSNKANENSAIISFMDVRKANLYNYINKFSSLPPGVYEFFIEDKQSHITSKHWTVDSLLPLDNVDKKKITNEKLFNNLIKKDKSKTYNLSNGRIDVYYQGIFHGYYDVMHKRTSNFNTLKNELSLISTLRELIIDSTHKEITGNIDFNSSFSNQVDPFTNYNNNYSEISGTINIPIMGIPITINGYYTTQDLNRTIKSSFINFNLDRNKIEENLNKNKELFTQSIQNVKNEKLLKEDYFKKIKSQLNEELKRQKNLIVQQIKDSVEDLYVKSLMGEIDSNVTEFQKLKQNDISNNIKEKYDSLFLSYNQTITKLELIETKIKNYSDKIKVDSIEIFEKYKNYDFGNPKEVGQVLDKVYPQVSSNKAYRILKRVKTFNIGMISDRISKYSNPGILNQGLNFAYDLEYFSFSVAGGKLSLINLDTSKTQYLFYNVGLSSADKSYGKFSLGMMQYFDGKMFNKNKNDADLSHGLDKIYNFSYSLQQSYATIEINLASIGKFFNKNYSILDGSAFHILSKSYVWNGNLEIDLEFERIGSNYQVPTLQYLIKGTNKYVIGVKGYMWDRKIKYAIGWNTLMRENGYNQMKNQKMAFEFQTQIKGWPNLKLSYKPFTTFNTISDTFTNVSFALNGDILSTSLNYKKTRKQDYISIDLLYIKNSSNNEQIRYENSNLSLIFAMKKNKNSYNFSLGRTTIQSPILSESQILMNNNYFVNGGVSFPVLNLFNMNIGGKVGWNEGLINNSFLNITIYKNWQKLGINSFIGYVRQNISTGYDKLNINMVNMGFSLPINIKY